MPSYIRYNQLDVNQHAGQSTQKILRQIWLTSYDVLKWVIDFIGSMFKMFLGK